MITDLRHSTNFALSKSTIGVKDDLSVSVTVHNTGSVDGKEVVQVSNLIARCSLSQPLKPEYDDAARSI